MGSKVRAFIRSNLLGLIAIFIALGGTAAATQTGGGASTPASTPALVTRAALHHPTGTAQTAAKKKSRRGPRGPQGPSGPQGPAGLQGTPGAPGAPATIGPWHVVGQSGQPTFGTGWSQVTTGVGLVAFRKDSNGHVYLTGWGQHSGLWNSEDEMFILPPGYRPTRLTWIPINGTDSANTNRAVIFTTGEVLPAATNGTGFAALDGVSFFTDAP